MKPEEHFLLSRQTISRGSRTRAPAEFQPSDTVKFTSPRGKKGKHKSSFTAVIEVKYSTWVYLSLCPAKALVGGSQGVVLSTVGHWI